MQIASLQYLRGLAALLVLLAHSFDHYLNYVPDFWGKCGQIGVQIFFVISGFIISYSAGAHRFEPVQFILRRAVRIVPIYWICTLLTALGVLLAPSAFKTTRLTFDYFLASLFFIPMYRPEQDQVIVPLMALGYTLNFEMFFYFVFMILFFMDSTTRAVALVITFGSAIALGQIYRFDQAIPQFYTSVQISAFCGGVIICEIYRKYRARVDIMRGVALVALLLTVTTLPVIANSAWKEFFSLKSHLIVSIFATSLCLLLLCYETLRRIGDLSALTLIGNASYSIYIAHMFIVALAFNLLKKLGVDLSSPFLFSTAGVLTALVALAGSLLFYMCVEKPITEFAKSRLNDRRKLETLPSRA